ncbi:MAG: DUF3160 domain-containing protein [Candidatus Eisenbacteria bacterium]|nr:DUF3160 domain-containing protein [Candidatus Eisenbacteria bacterium]
MPAVATPAIRAGRPEAPRSARLASPARCPARSFRSCGYPFGGVLSSRQETGLNVRQAGAVRPSGSRVRHPCAQALANQEWSAHGKGGAMPSPRAVLLVIGFLAASILSGPASAGFDLDDYLDFLAAYGDLTTRELLRSHEPFGPYVANAPRRADAPVYFREVNDELRLTQGELELLQRHDFVVSERWAHPSFAQAFEWIYHKDLPAYVSTDAILHAVHRSYDEILARIEDEVLMPELALALNTMHENWNLLAARYGDDPGMQASLNDVDIYLTVARRLLHPGHDIPSQNGNEAAVNQIVTLAHREEPAIIALFGDTRHYDFSQFRPRGHYADEDYYRLRYYFRAMMWLGRTELRFSPPSTEPEREFTREMIDAWLLLELAEASGARLRLDEIDRILRLFIAPPDNVDAAELTRLSEELEIESADLLLDPLVRQAVRHELLTGGYTREAILSQIMRFGALRPNDSDDGVQLPFAFLLLGQRFLIDSFVTSQVVYPFVGCLPEIWPPHCRMLPDPLEVLYTLGNDDALPFLEADLEEFGYAAHLGALRYLIDSLDDEYWNGSLYYAWLSAIRALSMSGRLDGAPDYMGTGAWQQKVMTTQLAAWTELRHDNLLYGKQSYTGLPPTCSFPCTYVEPIPEFYAALEAFARKAAEAAATIPAAPYDLELFFDNMERTMSRLHGIAEKELCGDPFTEDELNFLRSVIYTSHVEHIEGCSDFDEAQEYGWYPRLVYLREGLYENPPLKEPDALVADVHTNPRDSEIFHVATGHPELGIFITAAEGYHRTAYVGPVSSYYEHVTRGFDRLTDEDWNEIYSGDPPARPSWAYAYLADRNGDVRRYGPHLVEEPDLSDVPWEWGPPDTTGTPSDTTETPPDTTETQPEEPNDPAPDPAGSDGPFVSIAPNPVRGGAIISLRLTDGGGAGRVRIYDSQGGLVRELHRGRLPSKLIHLQWDGADASGHRVASGVYYLRLETPGRLTTRKVTVMR